MNTNWIQHAQEREWIAPIHLALDVLEPFGVLGAQVLWVLQPSVGQWLPQGMLTDIAQALESPQALDELRSQLNSASLSD